MRIATRGTGIRSGAKAIVLASTLLLVAASCTSGASGDGKRTVLVDYNFDEFATFMLAYFPNTVTVHPGDTVEFRQAWTGEAHSVTMGTFVDELMRVAQPFLDKHRKGEPLPKEEPPAIQDAFAKLPWMMGENGVNQNAAQPCYLRTGQAPDDANTPCAKEDQRKQPFDGKFTFYNSGFIPYEGTGGNRFVVPLAKTIAPGRYSYYCNLHGPFMSGTIEVVPKSQRIPSQAEVSREARRQIDGFVKPLRAAYRKAERGKAEPPTSVAKQLGGRRFLEGNLAGLFSPQESIDGGIEEFIPRTIRTKVGEKVTWTILGGHTISFNVPRYFPIFEVAKDGSVKLNEKIDPPAGGSPTPPKPAEEEGGPPIEIEAPAWDGSGFYSSGVIFPSSFARYSMSFSKPGKYRYACLIHPPMVGEVIVTA